MKKILCLLLAIIMLLCTACGDEGTSDQSNQPENSASSELDSSVEESVAPKEIKVPDITGLDEAAAVEKLEAAGFVVKVKKKPNDDVPAGQISGTDREVGSTAMEGDAIWLYISTGKTATSLALEPKLSELVTSRPKLEQGDNSDYVPLNYEYMKAVWISQYDMDGIYNKGGLQTDKEKFREVMKNMFTALSERGFNTAIVQLRPNGDSFYPSAYYPPSKYAVGFYGGEFIYDPLPIMIEEAHAASISFHAWINPLRCMEAVDMSLINVAYGVRDFEQNHNGDYIVNWTDGRYYLNPGYEEVRQLIINGATEIVRYYDVDGVHMDDYFYPTQDVAFDNKCYNDQTEFRSIHAFRFANINKLVSGLYSAVKAENPNVMFGISPAGNVGYTRELYADVNTWLSHEGYVDYIMPQIYWGLQHRYSPFGTVYSQWSILITVPGIKLIVGMSLDNATKGFNGESTAEWNNNRDILNKCLTFAMSNGECSGFSLFSLNGILTVEDSISNPSTAEEINNLFALANTYENSKIVYTTVTEKE